MTPLLRGDLTGLRFPDDLPQLREEALLALREGAPLSNLFRALAAEHPMALGDLVVGPKALEGAIAVREALGELDALEGAVPAGGLYQRLAILGEASQCEVLQAAVTRHPRASWLIRLSEAIEVTPGTAHLEATAQQPWFGGICRAHAQAGHLEALHQVATTGRLEPVIGLLAAGFHGESLDAGAAALHAQPSAPIAAHISALLGPQADQWLSALVSRLRSRESAEFLGQTASPFPQTSNLLAALLPGLR